MICQAVFFVNMSPAIATFCVENNEGNNWCEAGCECPSLIPVKHFEAKKEWATNPLPRLRTEEAVVDLFVESLVVDGQNIIVTMILLIAFYRNCK